MTDISPSPSVGEPGGARDSSDEDAASPGWAKWVTRISFVIGVAAMIVAVWAVGPANILGHLKAIGIWFIALLATEVLITTFDAAAMHAMVTEKGEPPYRRVLFAQVAGRAVNAVTPGGSLGEVTKASVLTESVPTSRAVAAVMFSSLASAVIQLIMIAIGAPLTALLLPVPTGLEIALIVTGVVAGAAAVVLTVLVRRGMLSALLRVGAKVRLISKARREKWAPKLARIDKRLKDPEHQHGRRRAVMFVFISKVLTWCTVWGLLAAAGYYASPGELAAFLSAGVVMGWLSMVVPLGLGVSETGNYGLFLAVGAPPELGVTLALARRVNYIFYAAIGFALLAGWRVSQHAAVRVRARRDRRAPTLGT